MLGRHLVRVLTLPSLAAYRFYEACCPGVGRVACTRCRQSGRGLAVWKRVLVLMVFFFLLIPFTFYQLTFQVRYVFKHENTGAVCFLPKLDAFDKSIMQFVWTPEQLFCDPRPSLIFVDDDGFVQFNTSSFSYYGGTAASFRCSYSILQRHLDDDHVIFLEPIELKPPVFIASDFFKVSCKNSNSKVIFETLLTNIYANSSKHVKAVESENEDQLSVLMFGLDSVSRSASVRKLPKTFSYLTQELKMYDFKGYMTVGENTLPNVTPLLTGKRVWTNEVPMTDYSKETFDKFPLLWKNFSDANYATLFAEDMPVFATFNYLTKGFAEQPTDHYMRPFQLGLQEMDKMSSALGPVFLFLENQKINVQKYSTLCHGNIAKHKAHLNYLKQFLQKYEGKRKFMYSFLSELSHEYPNFLTYGDDDFLEFFKWMKERGYLQNMALVFFSDHGARIDKIRNTFVGRIEEKMPVSMLYLPEHIVKNYPQVHKHLSINTNRLATAFDLHQTIGDILNRKYLYPSVQHVENRVRGISLFQQLPADRSCADAWIPENYCACYKSTPLNVTTSSVIKQSAEFTLQKLNQRLATAPQCAQLNLFRIQEAHQLFHGLKHTSTENTGISIFQFFKPEETITDRFFVVIETIPGHGIFEALVEARKGSFNIIGDLVRANRYGNQSSCITNKRLKSQCFCK